MGEVEPVEFGVLHLQGFDDPEALAPTAKTTGIPHQLVECVLHGMSERRVTKVATQGNRFRQVFVETEGAGEGAGDRGDLDGVGQTGTDVIPGSAKGNLGFVLQGAESGAVDDPFTVALELRAEVVGVLLVLSAEAFPAFGGVRGQQRGLFLFKILPSPDRHKIVMNDRRGESREGKLSEEQGVKKRRTKGNKFVESGKREVEREAGA